MTLQTPGFTPERGPRTSATTASGHTAAICASRVIGTDVTDRNGATIGEVKDIVLDKLSNNIMFAIVSFGGFLGIGEKYHPIPWMELDYDEGEGSYVVDFTAEQLREAPADTLEALTRNPGTVYRDRAYDYYDVPAYWESDDATTSRRDNA
jgi:sporulation protein YlmC with PRC-barrel domain